MFALIVLVAVSIAVLGAVLAARAGRGRPLSEFGKHPAASRSVDSLEAEDLAEMLDVTNVRRRARGLPERSLADAVREFGDE